MKLFWSFQGPNSGPMMHGMGQQGPNNKGSDPVLINNGSKYLSSFFASVFTVKIINV